MSTDNVIAVAAVANGSTLLLVLGLLVSIPLVVFGATLLMQLMQRYPLIITLGAAVLGWTAGELAITDPALVQRLPGHGPWLHWLGPRRPAPCWWSSWVARSRGEPRPPDSARHAHAALGIF